MIVKFQVVPMMGQTSVDMIVFALDDQGQLWARVINLLEPREKWEPWARFKELPSIAGGPAL